MVMNSRLFKQTEKLTNLFRAEFYETKIKLRDRRTGGEAVKVL